MSIRAASERDHDIVREIAHTTINEIYPRYYPSGAVGFFLRHHSDESIAADIADSIVFLCCDAEMIPVGTVTIRENEICRLFVLPGEQGRGYGKELIEFAENKIAEDYDEIVIDASLSAKAIYLKRGYKEKEYHTLKTPENDFLCYDVMTKRI